ncbi:MAG: RDD family protein [Mycobacteriales bacterium]
MARWTGTWLEGPGVTVGELRHPDSWPGKDLGLPREGSSSVAPFSARAFAFFLDILASALLAGLVNVAVHSPTPTQRQLAAYGVLALEHIVLVALTGQTLGMRALGLKVLRLKDVTRPPGLLTAVLRTVPLLLTVGLAGIFTRDGRGLHDLVGGSAVVRD